MKSSIWLTANKLKEYIDKYIIYVTNREEARYSKLLNETLLTKYRFVWYKAKRLPTNEEAIKIIAQINSVSWNYGFETPSTSISRIKYNLKALLNMCEVGVPVNVSEEYHYLFKE